MEMRNNRGGNMISNGECKYCKKVIFAIAMSKHLLACGKKINKEGGKDIFLIRASAGPFFVYFEINIDDTLKKIDGFLRSLWLECCGHLSAFTINNIRYYSNCKDSEPNEKTMNSKLSQLLSVNLNFFHEYDFGTTTHLNLKVIEKRKGSLSNIELIARNNLPEFKCGCGKVAKEICSQCAEEETWLLCSGCAKNHECEDEMLLPVINSPRMGMCAYTGD